MMLCGNYGEHNDKDNDNLAKWTLAANASHNTNICFIKRMIHGH